MMQKSCNSIRLIRDLLQVPCSQAVFGKITVDSIKKSRAWLLKHYPKLNSKNQASVGTVCSSTRCNFLLQTGPDSSMYSQEPEEQVIKEGLTAALFSKSNEDDVKFYELMKVRACPSLSGHSLALSLALH